MGRGEGRATVCTYFRQEGEEEEARQPPQSPLCDKDGGGRRREEQCEYDARVLPPSMNAK